MIKFLPSFSPILRLISWAKMEGRGQIALWVEKKKMSHDANPLIFFFRCWALGPYGAASIALIPCSQSSFNLRSLPLSPSPSPSLSLSFSLSLSCVQIPLLDDGRQSSDAVSGVFGLCPEDPERRAGTFTVQRIAFC